MNIKINISATLAGLLFTAALAASCTKIHTLPDNDPQEISMKCLETKTVLPDTKANLSEASSFGLFAYATEDAGGTPWYEAWPAVADASPYLSNVSFGNIDGSWVGCDFDAGGSKTHYPYYYPLSGSLLFAGYSPHHSLSNGTVTSVNLVPNVSENNPYLQIGFTQDPSAMVDLLWFDVKDVAAGTSFGKETEEIPVTFKHALSKVSFTFIDSYHIYSLKSVTLKGLVNQGTFYSGLTPGWMPELARNTLMDYSLLTTKTLLDAWTSADQYIIPQYLDGIFPTIGQTLDSGVDVVLEFEVTSGVGSQKIEILLKNHTERWELGKSYRYTITANADPIEFGSPTFTIATQTVSM